jgi:hypothetical protein
MPYLHILAQMPTHNANEVHIGLWYPEMPPRLRLLNGLLETQEQYTDRVGNPFANPDYPYDHRRGRQCSLGWHAECSDTFHAWCQCPHHEEAP